MLLLFIVLDLDENQFIVYLFYFIYLVLFMEKIDLCVILDN